MVGDLNPTPVSVTQPWKSKTLWASVIVAIATFLPVVGPAILANQQWIIPALGFIFGALRLTTDDAIGLK